MLCCICRVPGHLGANFDYSWICPTVRGAPTDEAEIVNIEDKQQHCPSADDSSSIDKNLPLASALSPSTQNQSDEHIDPSPQQPDLTALALPEPNQPDPLPEQQPTQLSQPSEQPTPLSHSSKQPSQCSQSSKSTPTDSQLITSQGLIPSIKSAMKPPSRRTPAKPPDEPSLACPRTSTAPTLVTGKPRSSIPVPTASHTPILVTANNPEEEMETTHELRRRSSSSELSTPYLREEKGRDRSREPNRAEWLEEGERPSRYFFNLQRIKAQRSHTSSVYDSTGVEVSSQEEIEKAHMDFYTQLFSEDPIDAALQDDL
ncbi:hypothetical protein AWC38_SpisGene18534 [Stylophora pistillata]|uniref:Uncharacterized protein n=1 Tax=Stylophora pistillata TaxID=50429 RepID=A0A2B4RKY7_STYPI|nr:hypothetical protein AWC38_SpisGene18534 [Stylophora pistillata]